MQRIMRIKGPDKTYREPITDFQSLRFTGEVSTLPIIEFEVRKESHGADGLEVDGYIETPVYIGDTTIYDYVIKDIKLTTDGVYSVYAIQDAEALKNEPIGFFTVPGTFYDFIRRFSSMMNPKGWLFVIEDLSIRNIKCTLDHNSTIWEAMLEICQQAGARWYIEQRGQTQTGRVNAVVFYGANNFPRSTSLRLFPGINLKGYEREHNTNDVITKICPLGKDRLMLNGERQNRMEVPPDDCWIVDTSKYSKVVPAWVEFSDVETVEELRAAGLAYIQTVNAPYICYTLDAVDLSRITERADWDEFDLGSYVEFLDAADNVVVSSYIVKLTLDLLNPENNQMDISMTAQSFINSSAEERRKTADAKALAEKAIQIAGGGAMNLPAVSLGKKDNSAGSQSIGTTITKLNLGTDTTVNTDPTGVFFEITAGQIKFLKAGVVIISASVYLGHSATAGYESLYLFLNGAEKMSDVRYNIGTAGTINFTTTITVNEGDYVDIRGRANAASTFYYNNLATTLDAVYISY